MYSLVPCFFFFKQKTAYEMRISDWSSDVCSSVLLNYPDLKPPLSRQFKLHEWQEAYDEAEDVKPFAVLRREDYPMLVSFGDLGNPKSVGAVNPDMVGVRRITLQVTDDPVTTGIEKRLGWLGAYPESRLDGVYRGDTGMPLARRLSNGDFRMEPI